MRNMPRVFTSFMPNAPRLPGVPGAMLDIFKKCLSGGWTPFDILKIDVSNGIATISMSATSYSLPDYCRLMISDCDEPQLNKEWTITRGGNTAAQFETTVADGTYGGAIKAVPEPAGWELVFSGTNEAIIRSANQDSSRTIVKIVDQNATTCGFDFDRHVTKYVNNNLYGNFTAWNRNYEHLGNIPGIIAPIHMPNMTPAFKYMSLHNGRDEVESIFKPVTLLGQYKGRKTYAYYSGGWNQTGGGTNNPNNIHWPWQSTCIFDLTGPIR